MKGVILFTLRVLRIIEGFYVLAAVRREAAFRREAPLMLSNQVAQEEKAAEK